MLAVLIDRLIENGEFAFSSRSEFVKDAIRRYLEYHGYYPKSGIMLEKSKITINPSVLNTSEEKIAEINSQIKMLHDIKTLLSKEIKKG